MVRHLIVPVQKRCTIICCHQDVQVAVTIEISVCQSSPHFLRFESAASTLGYISKLSAASVQEELRRLRVSGVPSHVSDVDLDGYLDWRRNAHDETFETFEGTPDTRNLRNSS